MSRRREAIGEIDGEALRAGPTCRPLAWEDQVRYVLMPDRFSDGHEDGYLDVDGRPAAGTAPPLRSEDRGSALATAETESRWRAAGARWCGGTLPG